MNYAWYFNQFLTSYAVQVKNDVLKDPENYFQALHWLFKEVIFEPMI